jgi:hypothetical protein
MLACTLDRDTLSIAGNFDKVPVGISDVNRTHAPPCACLFNWSEFDLDRMRPELSNNFLNLPITHETYVASSWHWDVCVWEVFCSEGMQVDFLISKVKGVKFAFKQDVTHP